jgi:hypothetical protein
MHRVPFEIAISAACPGVVVFVVTEKEILASE